MCFFVLIARPVTSRGCLCHDCEWADTLLSTLTFGLQTIPGTEPIENISLSPVWHIVWAGKWRQTATFSVKNKRPLNFPSTLNFPLRVDFCHFGTSSEVWIELSFYVGLSVLKELCSSGTGSDLLTEEVQNVSHWTRHQHPTMPWCVGLFVMGARCLSPRQFPSPGESLNVAHI